jgi:HemY protein
MKAALWAALALVVGGLLAHLLLADPGYVAMRGGPWLFETTLPVFLLLLAATLGLTWLLARVVTARRRLARIRAQRRRRRARAETAEGTLALAAGQWKRAEELLVRAAPDSDSPAANYLVAARAADLQDAVKRRDELLARAQEAAPERRAAALITLAEMQMRRGQDTAALQTLEQLDASGDLNARGLGLMARLYRMTGQAARLRALEPRLRSAKDLPPAQVEEWLAQLGVDELRAAGEARDSAALAAAWSGIAKPVRRLSAVAVAYARAALACGDRTQAEKVLREVLDEGPDEAAARLYGELAGPDVLPALDRAEHWLRQRPQDADLLAACARLCLQAELVGKARGYLEAALALKPNVDDALLLAELLEQMGEPERASTVLRAQLASGAGRRVAGTRRVRLRR